MSWHQPFPIAGPNNAQPGAITAFSRNPNQIDVFWIGPDGGVGSNYWNIGEGWHQPFPIAGPNNAQPGAITAFSRNPNQIDVFWIGPDGGVGSNYWNIGEGWHQPFPIAGPNNAQPGAITAFSRNPNQIDVFWIGPDGGVGSNYWNIGEGWHQPFPIAGSNNAQPGAITAFSRNPNQIDVFWIGPDGGVGSNYWNLEVVVRTSGDQLDFEFSSITFGGGVPVGGFAHLTMFKSGNCRFTGHFHDSGATEYNMAVVLTVKDSEGMLYTIPHQGHVSGTFQSGSRDDDWDVSVQDDRVASRWSHLAAGSTAQLHSDANGDLVSLTNSAIGTAGLILGVIALFA